MPEVIRADGTIDFDELRYRYEHIAPQHVGRRVATQIAGTTDLKSLPKKDRRWIGKRVGMMFKKFGWMELAAMSNQYEIDHPDITT